MLPTREWWPALIAAGVSILLAMVLVLQMIGWGQRIAPTDAMPDDDILPRNTEAPLVHAGLQPAQLSAITARPIFSENRAPMIPIRGATAEGEGPGQEIQLPPAQPLRVNLAGVVIIGERRMALINDPATGRTSLFAEGMPLEGEQGGWTLKRVDARSVVFDSGLASGETEIELSARSSGQMALAPGSNQAMGGQAGTAQPTTAPAQDPQTRAEEIRRRVEERRRQLREQAAQNAANKQ